MNPNRRDVLGVIGTTGVLALVGCGSDSEASTGTTNGDGGGGNDGSGGSSDGTGGSVDATGGIANGSGGASTGGVPNATGGAANATGGAPAVDGGDPPPCVVRPQQTEGPYFIDERLNRSDIRSDPTDGTMTPGAELSLELVVYRIDGAACVPVEGALVDIWQCDADGIYAGVVDAAGQFDTTGKKFLRGYQLTDASGLVRFTTIYPGWYTGRSVHIHFKVRLDPDAPAGYEFTSQLYFEDSLTQEIAAQLPYSARTVAAIPNANDGIFVGSGGAQLMLDVQRDGDRYRTRFDLGFRVV